MSDLADIKLGTVGDIKLKFEGGALKLSVEAALKAEDVLTLVENAIPGDLDNKIIDGLKLIVAKIP